MSPRHTFRVPLVGNLTDLDKEYLAPDGIDHVNPCRGRLFHFVQLFGGRCAHAKVSDGVFGRGPNSLLEFQHKLLRF
jgi:hypothetical protein